MLRDAPVAGRFGPPSPCLGVITQRLKVCQLMSQRWSELGGRGEVIALLADVRVRARAGSLLSRAEGLVDTVYEKHSVVESSNLHPAGFGEFMPKTLAVF